MKKLLFLILSILFIISSIFINNHSNNEFNKEIEIKEEKNVDKVENEKVDFNSTNVDSDSTMSEIDIKNVNEVNEIKKEETKTNVKKKIDTNSVKVESHSFEEENNSVNKESDTISNDEIIKAESNNPWDDLGITENDYYNKPMWSWARVDYSINDYGNISATQQACIDAGNNMMEDILSYSCTSINSYSGDYLGEMLRIKY